MTDRDSPSLFLEPGSPGAPDDLPVRPAKSAKSSPAVFATSEDLDGLDDGFMLPAPVNQGQGEELKHLDMQNIKKGPAPVPPGPPPATSNLLDSGTGIADDESYGRDERTLNEFLTLHPMLSLEATSQKTLQLMSNLFQKASIKTKPLPVVTKSHDDHFLRPANKQIGERECVCGERCLANWMAQIRYGEYDNHQFTCVEFLLPDAYAKFLNGKGLPPQRVQPQSHYSCQRSRLSRGRACRPWRHG